MILLQYFMFFVVVGGVVGVVGVVGAGGVDEEISLVTAEGAASIC